MKNSISFRRHVKVRGTGHQSYIYSLLRTTDVKPGTLGVSLVQVRRFLTGLQPENQLYTVCVSVELSVSVLNEIIVSGIVYIVLIPSPRSLCEMTPYICFTPFRVIGASHLIGY